MVLANDSAEVTDVVLLPSPSADDILTDEEEGDSVSPLSTLCRVMLPAKLNSTRLMPTNVKQICRNKRLRDQKNRVKILVSGSVLHSIRAQ